MFHLKSLEGNDMTLKEARAWMLSNPGKKITCQYFHDEWIMFDGSLFVFEDGVQPSSWWWADAYEFKCEWYELKEDAE